MSNKSDPPDLAALRSGLSRIKYHLEQDFGYLPGFFLEQQIAAIKNTIHRSEQATLAIHLNHDRLKKAYDAHRGDGDEQTLEDAFFDSVMQDAAHNLTTVGLISAFVESTITATWLKVESIGCKERDVSLAERRRKVLANKCKVSEFWNPRHYCQRNGALTDNWALGSDQLAKIFGLNEHLPNDFKRVCVALQAYRNFMLHNGLLWSDCKADAFSKQILDNKWEDWFESETAPRIRKRDCDKPTRGWMFRMTPAFQKRCFQCIDEFAQGVAAFLFHNREARAGRPAR